MVAAINSNTPKIEGLNNILFPSSTVLHYTDPYLYQDLIARTNLIMKEAEHVSHVTVDHLCTLARHNFNKLLKLQHHSAEEAQESR